MQDAEAAAPFGFGVVKRKCELVDNELVLSPFDLPEEEE